MDQLNHSALPTGVELYAVGNGISIFGTPEVTCIVGRNGGAVVMECSIEELVKNLGLYRVADIGTHVLRKAAPLRQSPVLEGPIAYGLEYPTFNEMSCRGPLTIGRCKGTFYYGRRAQLNAW